MQVSYGCMSCRCSCNRRTFFFFSLNLSSAGSGCGHVGLLFTHEEHKVVGLWSYGHFCHKCNVHDTTDTGCHTQKWQNGSTNKTVSNVKKKFFFFFFLKFINRLKRCCESILYSIPNDTGIMLLGLRFPLRKHCLHLISLYEHCTEQKDSSLNQSKNCSPVQRSIPVKQSRSSTLPGHRQWSGSF